MPSLSRMPARLPSLTPLIVRPVDCQGCYEGRSNPASILGGNNFNGVAASVSKLVLPVQNLLQCLCLTSLEMRVLVEDGAVGANMC
jgi:hypothetical protein